jgi:hypothetical protein
MMRKLITLTLAVLLVGLFAAVVFAAVESGDDSSTDTVGTIGATGTTERTTTTPDDISTTPDDISTTPDDISGPCDEAEHANDPRCAGVQPGAAPGAGVVDDHRGRGRSRGRGGDGHGDGSGRGPGHDDSRHGGDDSGFDDSGGHRSGHGGDDSLDDALPGRS